MANYNTQATVTLSVNGHQARQMLSRLQQDAQALRQKIAQAAQAGDKASMARLQRELSGVNATMRQLTSTARTTEQVLQHLDKASPKELRRTLTALQRDLGKIERGSEAWKAQTEKIRQVKAELATLNAELSHSRSAFGRVKDWLSGNVLSLVGLSAGFAGLTSVCRGAVQAYADMDKEMVDVAKFTGMTRQDVERLNEEFRKMDTRTSREQLNRYAQEAGRLGKSSVEDVLGFVRAADQVNIALEDLGDGATLAMSKLAQVFGDEQRLGTERSLLAIGSVINTLSQNCAASAPYLAEFATRMGGVGSQAGMTISQVIAFGAVLDSAGQNVEQSSTALQKLITGIYTAPAKYARAAGLEVRQFSDLVRTDMNGALMLLLDTLKQTGNMDRLAPIFADMGEKGSGAIKTISTLAGHIDELRAQQQAATQAFEKGTGVSDEAAQVQASVASRLEKSKKEFHELSLTLGAELLPAVNLLAKGGVILVGVLRSIIEFAARNKIAILSCVAAYTIYKTAVSAAAIKTALLTAAEKAGAAIRTIGRVASLMAAQAYNVMAGNAIRAAAATRALNAATKASTWGLVLAGLTAVVGLIIQYISKSKEATDADRLRESQTKRLNALTVETAREAAREVAALDALYTAATNEALSKEQRRQAAQRLLALYPEQFRGMTAEQIMLGKAITQYNNLRTAILSIAKAKAAARLIEENSAEILRLEQEGQSLLQTQRSEQQAKQTTWNPAARGQHLVRAERAGQQYMDGVARRAWLHKQNSRLAAEYGTQQAFQSELGITEPQPETVPQLPSTPAPRNRAASSHSDRFVAEKKWLRDQQDAARVAYYTGQTDYATHLDTLDRLALEYYDRILSRQNLSLAEQAENLEARAHEQERQTAEQARRDTEAREARAREEEADHLARLSEIKQFYIDGQISRETYDIKSEEEEIRHQRALILLTEEGTQARAQAEGRLQDLLITQSERARSRTERAMQAEADMRRKYFTLRSDRLAEMQGRLEALAALRDLLLTETEDPSRREEITRAYSAGVAAIHQEYGETPQASGYKKAITDFASWLEGDGGKALTGTMSTLVSAMGEIFSGLTTMMQAELEMQTAAIERYYSREISLAEGNAYQEQALERQKQNELARAKADANKKQFSMQVIQAVAQTAQNALAAYGSAAAIPIVGHVMAPIAAAMAVAAGTLQIAAIKKQQQAAEAQGYSEGGFTPRGPRDRAVGIVHAGEWVASQALVNAPGVRPLLEALDQAQHSGPVATLRASDVSRAITAPMVMAAAPAHSSPVVTSSPSAVSSPVSSPFLTETLTRLADRLERPFVTVNTVTGDRGTLRAQQEYDLLIRNKTPKSRS